MAYYYYKLVADSGGAPCIYRGLLSLAICKPQIRSTAIPGDWLFGFGGRSTIGERLIYIARVTKKIPNGEYYQASRYKNRPDSIYEWHGNQLRWKKGSLYHAGGSETDIGQPPHSNAAVLISSDFRYFGAEGTEGYKDEFPIIADAVSKLGVGHRVNHPEKLEVALTKLRQKMWKDFAKKKNGLLSQADKNQRCDGVEGRFLRGSC